eukprot:scaffold447656_cov36-Prasinocladus_malaysianus.AAC.1
MAGQAGLDKARAQGKHLRAPAIVFVSPAQLGGKKEVGELAVAVGHHAVRLVRESVERLEVESASCPAAMNLRGHHDDPAHRWDQCLTRCMNVKKRTVKTVKKGRQSSRVRKAGTEIQGQMMQRRRAAFTDNKERSQP